MAEFERKCKGYFAHREIAALMHKLDRKLTEKEITPGKVIDHFNLWPHLKKDNQHAK